MDPRMTPQGPQSDMESNTSPNPDPEPNPTSDPSCTPVLTLALTQPHIQPDLDPKLQPSAFLANPRRPCPGRARSVPAGLTGAPPSSDPHLADLRGVEEQAASVKARAVPLQEVAQAAAGQVLHDQPQAQAA